MKQQSSDGLVFYQFEALAQSSDLYHGAFTRLGGVSQTPFESLNLARSVGDDVQAVQENNRRMLSVFDMTPDRATTAWLVHGKAVAVMTHADAGNYRQGMDAIITRERGLALTTIATMLRKMEDKGVVAHRAEGRQFVYRPTVSEELVRRSMVGELVERLFGGDPKALVAHLVSEHEIDGDEVEALRRRLGAGRRRGR